MSRKTICAVFNRKIELGNGETRRAAYIKDPNNRWCLGFTDEQSIVPRKDFIYLAKIVKRRSTKENMPAYQIEIEKIDPDEIKKNTNGK